MLSSGRAAGARFDLACLAGPFFYPVLNEEYATRIAKGWNTKDGGTGYVLRFQAVRAFMERYPVQTVGSRVHQEYWIPAEDLHEFNRNLIGSIEVVRRSEVSREVAGMAPNQQVHIVIPEGTKVLTRSDPRVGVVIHAPSAPEHGYRVRFADGVEESFRRSDLTIFKHVQAEVPGGTDAADLYRFVIYRCIVGSTAYGLSQEGSDTDRRGFYLPPAELEWSLAGGPVSRRRQSYRKITAAAETVPTATSPVVLS